MLPAPKEINLDKSVPSQAESPLPLSPGKVVDSIHGLRQRLQDIDFNQITDAANQISNLQERLLRLQKTLGIVIEVSSCQSRVRKAADQITYDLNRVKHEIPQQLSHLQPIGEIHKLIAIHKLARALSETRIRPTSSVAEAIANPDSTNRDSDDPSRLKVRRAVQLGEESQQHILRSPAFDEIAPTDQEELGGADTHSVDSGATGELPSFASEREFPAFELVEKATLSQPAFVLTEDAAPEVARTETINQETHTAFTAKVSIEPKQEPTPVAATSSDFDEKLLDDLIRNYGEFFASPQLSTTAEPLTQPATPQQSQSDSQVTSQTNLVTDKTLVTSKGQGDLDRKLKKLIKDYGQVDLYPQHSSVKTKLAALGAFALLGAVLSGIYYFSAPKQTVTLHPSPSDSHPAGGTEATTDSSAPIDKKSPPAMQASETGAGDLPPAIDASGSLAVKDKPTAQKKLKKGGSKQ